MSTSCVTEDTTDAGDTRSTHLELVHDRQNLALEGLIRDFSATQVHLVAHEDDGNLDAHIMVSERRASRGARAVAASHSSQGDTHIDTKTSKAWKPVCGYPVE